MPHTHAATSKPVKAPKSEGLKGEVVGHHSFQSSSLLASDTWQPPPECGPPPLLSHLLMMPFHNKARLLAAPRHRAPLQSQPGSLTDQLPAGSFSSSFPRTAPCGPSPSHSQPCLSLPLCEHTEGISSIMMTKSIVIQGNLYPHRSPMVDFYDLGNPLGDQGSPFFSNSWNLRSLNLA